MNNEETPVENTYQGLFITETVLGNPNGSFVGNEPRNIDGRVFTTDKCIKYNVRNYLKQNYEELGDEDEPPEKFVFFYPRRTEDAEEHAASYMTKDTVFEEYFEENFDDLLDASIDARIFGGTFSFTGGGEKFIYGPVQISYGLDLVGADVINLRVGTPFSTDDGSQTTTGENKVVDHAVIGYDLTINPNNSSGLLKESDLEFFKESLVKGTNLRKSTSKSTDSKALVLVEFGEGKSLNLGEMKHLIEVASEKITDPKERPKELRLDLELVRDKLDDFEEDIEEIEIYADKSVDVRNFYEAGEGTNGFNVVQKQFKDL